MKIKIKMRKGTEMPFKISVAALKETLEAQKLLIDSALAEMTKENIEAAAVKSLLEKLDGDIDSFVSKIQEDYSDGLKEYDMVKYLNNMLEIEYSGIFDYNYYAARVSDESLADKLREFGAMELEHAHLLTRKIKKLGAIPVTPGAHERKKHTSIVAMLKEHAKGEQEAVKLCEEGVKMFTDPEFQWILGTIRVDEQSHQKEIKELIKKFENVEMVFSIQEKYNPPKDIDYDSDEPWIEG